MLLYTHPACLAHDPGIGHPESPARLRTVLDALDDPSFAGLVRREAPRATRAQLARVHAESLIDAVFAAAPSIGHAQLDADTAMSPDSLEAALRAAGAVCAAVDALIDGEDTRAFCAVRPPGHHATRDTAMGFCLFNNVAAGATQALTRGLVRAAIVDFDVHHGNGTQDIFWDDPTVLFVSMHQWPWYPGTGAADDHGPHATVWNVPMSPGLPPEQYVDAFQRAVDAATRDFAPDLVLISAGFDSLAGDPLGGFTLEYEHVELLTRDIVGRAEVWCGGRVVSSLEGGYVPERLGVACIAHMRALE